MNAFRLAVPICAAFALAGCVAYPAAPVAYAPPPGPVYVAPHARRVWVPRQCDRYGRCRGGYWR